MAPREVTVVRGRLATIAMSAVGLAEQLEDLHVLANDRQVRETVKVAGGSDAGVENVGDERAKDLWRRIQRELRSLEMDLVALEQAAGNLLSTGRSAPETRGSTISKGEFVRQLRGQQRRRTAGEYTPKRNLDQPRYPGRRG